MRPQPASAMTATEIPARAQGSQGRLGRVRGSMDTSSVYSLRVGDWSLQSGVRSLEEMLPVAAFGRASICPWAVRI